MSEMTVTVEYFSRCGCTINEELARDWQREGRKVIRRTITEEPLPEPVGPPEFRVHRPWVVYEEVGVGRLSHVERFRADHNAANCAKKVAAADGSWTCIKHVTDAEPERWWMPGGEEWKP